MNLTRILPLVLMLVLGALSSESALAQRHGGGRGGWHGGPRIGLGIALAIPLLGLGYYAARPYYYAPSPYYYPPANPYYYPPGAAQAPQAYYEQGGYQAPPAAQESQGSWYYCAAAGAYYPYVRECPGGWRQVSPQPPPG